jgi:hypothetical protein
MKNSSQLYVFGALVLLLAGSVSACARSGAAQSQLSGQAADVNRQILDLPAQFEVGPLTVQRSGLTVGETATVATAVTNVGDKQGTYAAVLTLDGDAVEKRDISVAPGRTEGIQFKVTVMTPGVKNIAVGTSAATISGYSWPHTIIYDSDTRLGGEGPAHGSGSNPSNPTVLPPISVRGNYGHMVRFTPPAVPFKVQKIWVNGEGRVRNKADWDSNHVTVKIWDDKSNMLWSVDLPWRLFRYAGDWNAIDVPDIRVNGDFNVEFVTHSGQQDVGTAQMDYADDPADMGIYIGWDRPQSYLSAQAVIADTRSTISSLGKPIEAPSTYKGLNWYIRVVGDGSLSN